jgi:hypothetical protein
VLTFEDYDGVLDADGCHDFPGADSDGDGFTETGVHGDGRGNLTRTQTR